MRKYLGNKHFYLNDSNRILGYGNNINAFALFLIAKLSGSTDVIILV